MNADGLRALADAFASYQLDVRVGEEAVEDTLRGEPGPSGGEPVQRPGRWLIATLGLSLTAVGLAYRQGPATQRYLEVIDTRSTREMSEWDGRVARGWLRRNITAVGAGARPTADSLLEGETEWSEDKWASIVQSLDVADFGFWGPGEIATTARLERVMATFTVARLVDMDLGSHAAFSFMTGANPVLGGESPLLHIANFASHGMEEALTAADDYLARR